MFENGHILITLSVIVFMKKISIILLFLLSIYSHCVDQTSVIQMTLTDSKKGLLNGNFNVELSLIDNSTNITYWTNQQTIYFKDGYTEFIIGPFDELGTLVKPRIHLEIDGSLIEFPIYPTLFSIQSQRSVQLNDTNAIYVKNGNAGFGTTTPTSKITIDGDITFLNDQNKILFKNGQHINSELWSDVRSKVLRFDTDIVNTISTMNLFQSEISSLIASINILQTQTGANPIQVASSLDNLLLKIDANGTISPLLEFYKNDSKDYLLFSNNSSISSTSLSDDFAISNGILSLANPNPLIFLASNNTIPSHTNAEIRFFNNDYYVFKDNAWHRLNHGVDPYLTLPNSTLTTETISNTNGALIFDGTDYYLWKNGWIKIDTSTPTTNTFSLNNTLDSFLVVDSNNNQFKRSLVDGNTFTLGSGGIQLNDTQITANQLLSWNGSQFISIDPSSSTISFQNQKFTLGSPLFVTQNLVGIGVEPTETLDVDGAIRLRTQTLSALSNVSEGTLVFDGSDFLGWNGTEWIVLSQVATATVTSNDGIWAYNNVHLTASPNNNVGLKTSNPQATLDINGTLRVRTIPTASLTNILMVDTDGDLLKKQLEISDFISNNSQSDIKLDSGFLSLSSMNATEDHFLIYRNNDWVPKSLSTGPLFSLNDFNFDLVTSNITANTMLLFDGSQWIYNTFPTNNSLIVFDDGVKLSLENTSENDVLMIKNGNWEPYSLNSTQITSGVNGLFLVSQNAAVGQQLTWDGAHWTPSNNVSLLFTGNNGIMVDGNTIKLADNLSWNGTTFSIGSGSNGIFEVNRLKSTLSAPINLVDGSNSTLLNVNSLGQLSIGYNGVHSGYSIASNGFNLFAHSISRYQSAIGTTNIGTAEFGPTLLIASVPTANPHQNRSILEVLDVNGESRLEVQESGNVGIFNGDPKATLDVNGYVKLRKYTSEPLSCGSDYDGSIALTSAYTLCVCNSTEWVKSSDGITSCQW